MQVSGKIFRAGVSYHTRRENATVFLLKFPTFKEKWCAPESERTTFRGISTKKWDFGQKSPCPVPEHGDGAAVAAVRRNGQIRRADHEILVDHGVVHAERAHLLERAVRVVADGIDEAHAEREVAAGVFIKQRIVKQDARLVDGAVIRHERALAKVGRAFVHGDELLQQGLVRARVRLDGAAVLEADGEILDELALVRQRLRRIDNALGLAALRRNEALLRGQVGVKIAAADRVLPAAAKLRLGDHADGEVRAVGCMVLQRRDAEAVEVVAARLQVSIVRVPRGDGVVVHAAGVQNCLPELFDSAGLRLVGEHLFRPRHAGHGRDAPLVAALHLVAVGA